MKQIQVAVGIIRNQHHEIFLTQRATGSHMACKWEFPGGKIEPGETAYQALVRELMEEAGIEVQIATPAGVAEHTYPQVVVTLHFFLVSGWQGTPWGREGQPHRWVKQADLVADEFPPANYDMVRRLVTGEF